MNPKTSKSHSISHTTTSAATLPIDEDAPAPPFYIQVHASVRFSTRPTLPVTLATWRTPLERQLRITPTSKNHKREEGEVKEEQEGEEEKEPSHSPAWLNSALTPLRSTTHPSKCAAPPALGWVARQRGGFPRDLRASWDLITVPPAGQGRRAKKSPRW